MWVRLGCSEAERSHLQEVRVSLEIAFERVPQASISDRLEETVCYARLTDLLERYAKDREFATVEKLGFDFFRQLKDYILGPHQLTLHLHKVKPPIPNLQGGVVFTLRD
jgi:7,8-dihydroneopterin aldolase/epimerase/oxygenase